MSEQMVLSPPGAEGYGADGAGRAWGGKPVAGHGQALLGPSPRASALRFLSPPSA